MPYKDEDSDVVFLRNLRRSKYQLDKKIRSDASQNIGELVGHKLLRALGGNASSMAENTNTDSTTQPDASAEPSKPTDGVSDS